MASAKCICVWPNSALNCKTARSVVSVHPPLLFWHVFFSSPLLPPPLPSPLYPGFPFPFTSHPPPPYLPLALPPFLQDGQGSYQNTIWNSETSHSAAGLPHINYSYTTEDPSPFTVKLLRPLRILLILHNLSETTSPAPESTHSATTHRITTIQSNPKQRQNLAPQAGPEPQTRTRTNQLASQSL